MGDFILEDGKSVSLDKAKNKASGMKYFPWVTLTKDFLKTTREMDTAFYTLISDQTHSKTLYTRDFGKMALSKALGTKSKMISNT